MLSDPLAIELEDPYNIILSSEVPPDEPPASSLCFSKYPLPLLSELLQDICLLYVHSNQRLSFCHVIDRIASYPMVLALFLEIL